jgi:hypothetical protein
MGQVKMPNVAFTSKLKFYPVLEIIEMEICMSQVLGDKYFDAFTLSATFQSAHIFLLSPFVKAVI